MPAPSKATAEAFKAILEAKRVGASDATAAAVGHIDAATLVRWKQQGQKAEPGTKFAKFLEDYQEAEAEPKLRALGVIWKAMPDKPDLAWKFIERRESGFAPPQPQAPISPAGPVVVNLSLTGGGPVPRWANAEVIDAQEVPALGDGDRDADTAAAT